METLIADGIELQNVVFTAFRNDAMPFVELPLSKQGILGISVLVTFGTMRWNSERVLHIGMPGDRRDPQHPNKCFQAVTPVIEGMFRDHRINAWLDTGSSRTYLTQRFAQRFPDVVAPDGEQTTVRLRGVGGSTQVRAISIPEVKFSAGNFDLIMRPAQVLPRDERVDRDWYDVWLGMDLLNQTREVSVDFKTLRFALK